MNEKELIASAGKSLPSAKKSPAKVLGGEDLSKLFGLDMADSTQPAKPAPSTKDRHCFQGRAGPGTARNQRQARCLKAQACEKKGNATANSTAQTKPEAKKKRVVAPTKPKLEHSNLTIYILCDNIPAIG